MKLKSLLLATAALATLATSCKKDDNNNSNNNNNAPSASSLTAGQGYITFKTDKAYNGGTSHTFKTQLPYDQTSAVLSGDAVTMQGIHAEVSGTTISKTSSVALQVYNAKAGKVDFGSTGAVFTMAVTNGSGGQLTEGYSMESGSMEITKFSNTEVEGKFSGKAVNDNASIDITNGTFAGKF